MSTYATLARYHKQHKDSLLDTPPNSLCDSKLCSPLHHIESYPYQLGDQNNYRAHHSWSFFSCNTPLRKETISHLAPKRIHQPCDILPSTIRPFFLTVASTIFRTSFLVLPYPILEQSTRTFTSSSSSLRVR